MTSTFGSTRYEKEQWRINWPRIIEDIRGEQIGHNKFSGLSFCQQANALELGFSTFQKYLQGTEPRYSTAKAILQLHTDMCGSASTLKRLSEFGK